MDGSKGKAEMGMLAKVEIDREICKGCDICVKLCRKGALRSGGKPNGKGYFPPEAREELCNGCGLCELYCPELAITVWRLDR